MNQKDALSYMIHSFEVWKESKKCLDIEVQGTSMWPVISPEDTVTVRCLDACRLRRGDIIAFWNEKNLMVHRMLRKRYTNGTWWVCEKGDNVFGSNWVPDYQVLGRVEAIRGPNRIVHMSRRPWTWINMLIGIISSFWISVLEAVRVLKISLFGNRPTPLLSVSNKWFSKRINKINGLISSLARRSDQDDIITLKY